MAPIDCCDSSHSTGHCFHGAKGAVESVSLLLSQEEFVMMMGGKGENSKEVS